MKTVLTSDMIPTPIHRAIKRTTPLALANGTVVSALEFYNDERVLVLAPEHEVELSRLGPSPSDWSGFDVRLRRKRAGTSFVIELVALKKPYRSRTVAPIVPQFELAFMATLPESRKPEPAK